MAGEAVITGVPDQDGGEWDNVDAVAPEEGQNLPGSEQPAEEAEPAQEEAQPFEQEEVQQEEAEQEVQPPVNEQPEMPPELAERFAQLEREREQDRQLAQFYMNQANTLHQKMQQFYQQQQQAQAQPQPQAPQLQPGQLPENVLPPSKWDLSNANNFYPQMEGYLDHRFDNTLQQARQQVEGMQNAIKPVFEAFHGRIQALSQHLAKQMHPDFDDVVKSTLSDAFVTDPSGKIVDIKNPALVAYFRQSPFPELAMYQYGLSKKAPQKIKEGVKQQTKNVVQKIAAKPKAPVTPKSASTQKQTAELDWETPATERDKILQRKGLL